MDDGECPGHTGGHTYVWAADLQYLPSFQAPDVFRIHLDTAQGTIVYEDRAGQLVSTGDTPVPWYGHDYTSYHDRRIALLGTLPLCAQQSNTEPP